MGHIKLIRSYGIVRRPCHWDSCGLSDDHRYIRLSKWNSRDLGCSDCRNAYALADESIVRVTLRYRNTRCYR